MPVPRVTYHVSSNTVSFCTVHNTHAQQGKSNFSFLCIHFSIFWFNFNLFIYFNTGHFIAEWTKYAAIILNTPTKTCVFISVINQLDAQNFCFTISLFHAATCFEHHVLVITASGIVTPVGGRLVHETAICRCDDTRGCVMQFWPPDDARSAKRQKRLVCYSCF